MPSPRGRRYPEEQAFTYQPHARAGEVYRWDEAAREAIRGYSDCDLRI